MRDEHDLMSSSTSPPPKKTKVNSTEEMDVDESEDDLSFKFEEMEIDQETNESSEATIEERSNMMDEKIETKNKRTDEKDVITKKKKEQMEKKKRIQERIKLETIKKETKKRKQKKKDEQKRRKMKVVENTVIEEEPAKVKVPNIRNIPVNCAHLVNKDDLLYVVPGDGCCGPNCAAAFLFHDEVFGPNLRKRMNQFQAKHWYNRYQYI